MDPDWEHEGFEPRASQHDVFMLRYFAEGVPRSEWCGSKRSALARFRDLVRSKKATRVEVLRYRCPKFPPSATHRQVAIWVLKQLGCTEKEDMFIRVEAHDPGVKDVDWL